MSIPKVTESLEELEFVTRAGAAPTDIGNVPCWQIFIESAQYLTDETENTLKEIFFREYEFPLSEADVENHVNISKEVYTENEEEYSFWVIPYSSFTEVTVGGVRYHIIQYVPSEKFVGIEVHNANPSSSIANIQWDAIQWRPSEL